MNAKSKRCPHFQLYTENLNIDGPHSYIAVRRCLLSERMVQLLEPVNESSLLTSKLLVKVGNTHAVAFIGPDLEAVSQNSCTVQRCEESCTPAYKQHLNHFGVQDVHEDEVTCSDGTETQEAATENATSNAPQCTHS